ncbi:MAG: flippase activity-associated protein Agl23 [Anaerolineae bacterium]
MNRSSLITVERAAYALIGVLAAFLRFFQLGLRPLSEAEAIQALAAFRFSQGAIDIAPAGTIPALFTGNLLAFSLWGAGDGTARWLPALAGVLLVLLPYGLRHRLGRGGALAASLLLALSPSVVFFSRTLGGAILVATCGLALAVGVINYLDMGQTGFLYLAAVALGVGVNAGSGFYSLLLIFSLFTLLSLLDRRRGNSVWTTAWRLVTGKRGVQVKLGAVLGTAFGLTATSFVLHLAGVSHAADLIEGWIKSFRPDPAGQPTVYPLLLLVRYEPLILLPGLLEVARGIGRGRATRQEGTPARFSFPLGRFLIFWAATGTFIVLIAGHRPPDNILLVVVPLALLAGQDVEWFCRWMTDRDLWRRAVSVLAIAFGILVFFYLQVAAYSLISPLSTISIGQLTLNSSASYLLLAWAAVLLLLGLGIAVWIWYGSELVRGSAWWVAVVSLALFGFRAMWGLNFAHAGDPRELMILQTTAPEVRLLVDRLEALSLTQSGDVHTLPVTVEVATGPVVAWYLREFDRQTVVETLSSPPETGAVVTLARQDLPIGEAFRGQGFPLRLHWLPWGLRGQVLVRWFFMEIDPPAVDQEVVLWVESE